MNQSHLVEMSNSPDDIESAKVMLKPGEVATVTLDDGTECSVEIIRIEDDGTLTVKPI